MALMKDLPDFRVTKQKNHTLIERIQYQHTANEHQKDLGIKRASERTNLHLPKAVADATNRLNRKIFRIRALSRDELFSDPLYADIDNIRLRVKI